MGMAVLTIAAAPSLLQAATGKAAHLEMQVEEVQQRLQQQQRSSAQLLASATQSLRESFTVRNLGARTCRAKWLARVADAASHAIQHAAPPEAALPLLSCCCRCTATPSLTSPRPMASLLATCLPRQCRPSSAAPQPPGPSPQRRRVAPLRRMSPGATSWGASRLQWTLMRWHQQWQPRRRPWQSPCQLLVRTCTITMLH